MRALETHLAALPAALLVALLIALPGGPAFAQVAPTPAPLGEAPPDGEADQPSSESVREVPQTAEERRKRALEVKEAVRQQIESSQGQVSLYQIVDEIVDELAADVTELNPSVVSPMAMKPVGLSSNLGRQFGQVVDATVATTLANMTNLVVKDCVACGALRSRIEGGEWVVTSGLVGQDDYAREAERLNVKTFLDTRFSYFPEADIVTMQVKVIRAEDGAILWGETYRSDATTAAIIRTGDRVISRAERVKELERLINRQPSWGYRLHFGASYIPYDSPEGGLFGGAAGGLFFERFGEDRSWLFGLGGDAFFNPSETNGIVGGFLGMHILYSLFGQNLIEPEYYVGGAIEGFLAGTEGNSVAFSALFDVVVAMRLGVGASVMYFVPVTFANQDLGGLGFKFRASINW